MADVLSDALAHPAFSIAGTSLALAGVALWLAAAWWAYADAGRRTDSTVAALAAAGWVILSTPFLLPISLAIYAAARPQQTAGEARTRALARALVGIGEGAGGRGCPSCGSHVDEGWLRCPRCRTWLATPCARCGLWSERALAACPFCGVEERTTPTVAAMAADDPVEPDGARDKRTRRGRRALRAMGPGASPSRASTRRQEAVPDARPLAGAGR